MIDPRFYTLIEFLWRGGSFAYFWTPDTDSGNLFHWVSTSEKTDVPKFWANLNCYFSVHPLRTSKDSHSRGQIVDVESVNCVFAEFDPAPGQSKAHLLQSIMQMDTPPSIIIDSGRGFHAYWLLHEPFRIVEESDRERIKLIQYAWIDHVGGDGAAKDLARVLRIPGSYNRKPELAPNFPQVTIEKFDIELTYELADLEKIVAPRVITMQQRATQPARAVVPTSIDDQQIITRMLASDPVAAALWSGDLSVKGGDHSKCDFALVEKFAFWTGRDRQRMDALFRQSGLYREKWNRDDYREKTLDQAIKLCSEVYTGKISNTDLGNPEQLVGVTSAVNFASYANGNGNGQHAPNGNGAIPPQPPPPVGGQGGPSGHASPSPAIAKTFGKSYSEKITDLFNTNGYAFRWNDLDDRIEMNGQPLNEGIEAIIFTLARDSGYNSREAVRDVLTSIAYQNRYHPIKQYLDGLTWDHQNHIGALTAHFVDTNKPITYSDGLQLPVFHVWLFRWMIGSIAKIYESLTIRAQNPMLVLDASQGEGKSTFVKWIGSPLPDLTIESEIHPDEENHRRYLASKWVWEVGELGSTTRKADREALKQFLTMHDVTFRKPYARNPVTKPAMASFIGTINNETGFLTDPTGNRRFLCVKIDKINQDYKKNIDINQLWAQARELYRNNETWRLTPEETERQEEINAYYMKEEPYIGWILDSYDIDPNQSTWLTSTTDIARTLQNNGVKGETRAIQMWVGDALKRLGLRQHTNARPRSWIGIHVK